tara:strand:+ start:584 stop:928 length:345 start_codon:yes stop_codon:yes gene_type:complete
VITKVCRSCSKEKPIEDFYSMGYTRSGKKKRKPTCKICECKEKRERYWNIIESHFDGWVCQNCGFVGHPKQYDCHHLNPSTKTIQISDCRDSPNKLKEELKQCELLCANCHRML